MEQVSTEQSLNKKQQQLVNQKEYLLQLIEEKNKAGKSLQTEIIDWEKEI